MALEESAHTAEVYVQAGALARHSRPLAQDCLPGRMKAAPPLTASLQLRARALAATSSWHPGAPVQCERRFSSGTVTTCADRASLDAGAVLAGASAKALCH